VLSGIVTGIGFLGNLIGIVSDETQATLQELTKELAKGVAEDFGEAGDAFGKVLDDDKASKFFDEMVDGAKKAAESVVDLGKKTAEIFPEDFVEKLAEGPIEAVKQQIEKAVGGTGGRPSGAGGNFRLDASVGRTQEKQVSLLTGCDCRHADLSGARHTESGYRA
jgi:hypothetical protein